MSRLGLADRQDLLVWADRVGASTELPRLVRRLILETGSGVARIGFPAGEGVRTGGWDGTVHTTAGTPFIPDGSSVWELSVRRSPGTKADEDYNNRVDVPDVAQTTDYTYVAVSLRPWTKRDKWATNRSREGRWKAVRALGVDDIETWLEQAPITHAWLSELLGLNPYGFRSAELWWRTWASGTTPSLTADIILAGRDAAVRTFRARLEAPPQVVTISGGNLQDILSFISAVAHGDPSTGDGYILPRVAFVEDLSAWRRLIDYPNGLVLVPLSEDLAQDIPARVAHHLVVPLVGSPDADIKLPPLDHIGVTAALRALGIDEKGSVEAGRLARRSLLALRRRLSNKRELNTPSWARPPIERLVRRILLAGRWSNRQKGDQLVLSSLTGFDYESLGEELAGLTVQEDPMITAVSGSWSLVSPEDAWLLLASQLRSDDLERFRAAALEVLCELDPSLGLPPVDMWKAALEGKVRQFSADLRKGLAISLALLGAHGAQIDAGHGNTGTEMVTYLVRTILSQANQDGTSRLWTSLADLLPLFAEAAPDAFLDGVRAGLRGNRPVLAGLFTDGQDRGLWSLSSPHSSLLWALECLAWSPDYFGQAVDLLARLADLDPGGRLTNRPINSLISIFCPWHPETSVAVEGRLDVLDMLRQRHAAIAWRLSLALMPKNSEVHDHTHEPVYREWKTAEVNVTDTEYLTFITECVRRLVQDAGTSEERWSNLLGGSTELPPHLRKQIRTELVRNLAAETPSTQGRAIIWETIRGLVAEHRQFPDADWALPSAELEEFEKIEQCLSPGDPLVRHLWLFREHVPDLGDYRRHDDYEEYDAIVRQRRRDAVIEIDKSGGLQAIRQLAEGSAVPWAVGGAIADGLGDKYKQELLLLIGPDDSSDVTLALSFSARRFQDCGWTWLKEMLESESHLDPMQRGRLLEATRDFPRAWQIAAELGDDVSRNFWQHFRCSGLGRSFAYVNQAARALIAVGRNAAALQLIDLYLNRQVEDSVQISEAIISALDGLLRTSQADLESRFLSQHDFQRLFDYLEQRKDQLGWDRIAKLEWGFLPTLGHKPKVNTLHQLLASDPGFFVSVVSAVYRPGSGEAPREPSEDVRLRARNAYWVLSSWRTVPGKTSDGGVDGNVLRQWVHDTVKLLEEANRLEVGEIHIGHMLASAPSGLEGDWPCIEVRDLLEELQSENVETGLRTEVYNRRGATTRRLEDGGEQERRLARKYREQAHTYRNRWPRTAAILRLLAESYEREARGHDDVAERFRTGQEN